MSEERKVQAGDVERRFVPFESAKVELRANGDDKKGIAGLGIPTGVTADIGPFTEEIDADAVREMVDNGWDVRGLFNHDPNMILGKTGSGTMTVKATDEGAAYEIPELPASRADVLESIERKDVDGNSFSFNVAEEEWHESDDLDKPHRVIKRFGRVFDMGPVTFPAYEGMTVVSARALEHVSANEIPEELRDKEPEEREDEAADAPETLDVSGEATEKDQPEASERANEIRKRKLQLIEAELSL